MMRIIVVIPLLLFSLIFILIIKESLLTTYHIVQNASGESKEYFKCIFTGQMMFLIPMVLYFCLPIYTITRESRILSRWKEWRVDRSGLIRKGGWLHGIRIQFNHKDQISPDQIVLEGKPVLWKKLTHNGIFPHLTAIHAEKYGIIPTCSGKINAKPTCIRLLLFWPVVLIIWYHFPFFFVQLPEGFPIHLKAIIISAAGCWVFSIALLMYSLFVRKQVHREFDRFLSQIDRLKHRLGCDDDSGINKP